MSSWSLRVSNHLYYVFLFTFAIEAPEVNKSSAQGLDLMTFWPWFQKSTKLISEVLVWWLSDLGSRSPQNHSQKSRFDDCLALACELLRQSSCFVAKNILRSNVGNLIFLANSLFVLLAKTTFVLCVSFIGLRNCFCWFLEPKQGKSFDQDFWVWFCRLLEQRPESHWMETSGIDFVDF